MQQTLRALKTKTGKAWVVIVLLATAAASVSTYWIGHPEILPIYLLIGIAWIAIVLSILASRLDIRVVNRRILELRDAGYSKTGPLSASKGKDSHGTRFDPTSIPPIPAVAIMPRRDVVALTIADEFTRAALEPEWIQVTPTPSNWKELIDTESPDLLFIESAWEGNDGEWRFHLTGVTAPRQPIIDVISYAKERGIPVVFWNKEDPPHFEDFLPIARLADYVFTTDGDLIPEYKKRLGHDRVYTLPFAAQPVIHNPAAVESIPRERSVTFGGMYFRDKYPERREQMDYLLPAAHAFGLEIFSRQLGSNHAYQFPPPYDKDVVGTLTYPQMVNAYRIYKAVLNVNSVPNSSTMCARRIFEATACGAAIVTPHSPATAEFFGETLSIVKNEDEARRSLRLLIESPEYRDRKVLEAQRVIWENHTYSHRVSRVLQAIGRPDPRVEDSITVFISTNRPNSLIQIKENILRQTVQPDELVIVTHGFAFSLNDFEEFDDLDISLVLIPVPRENSLGQNLNLAVEKSSGDVLVRMDDDDWYGKNYTRDMIHALNFSGASLVGKAATYIYFESMNHTMLTFDKLEHRFTNFVRGATFVGRREVFTKIPFNDRNNGEDSNFIERLLADGGTIYSSDRFNFVVNRWADKSRHTWTVADEVLYSTGKLKFTGTGQDQVEV